MTPTFIYTFAASQDEHSLWGLEMRSLFGQETDSFIMKSDLNIDPNRSPFIKEQIEVMYEGANMADILKQVEDIVLHEETFKVIFVKINDLSEEDKIPYEDRRLMERDLGLHIDAEADVHNPDHVFGFVTLGGRWYFGKYRTNDAVWLLHMKKPRNYSIALGTRLARAVANIAVPNPIGVQAIDPCCGIGTVLVEALSMGINIVGRDINPQIVQGARQNIAHFGYTSEVTFGDISDINESYDVAILDMPYNLFSTTTPEEQLSLLRHARRIANKVIVITIETIDDMITEAGFVITDRCTANKRSFARQVIVCS
ncbi:RNA methyltransferase [Paenibacillus crassostreae]|uniref:RNA methyltransferase n=2 Tax=Paenibacillus crassostreae TaxID=1763538 RepID=A0A162L7P5_9BACL|nr:RNA methyltransferase [Paenibacillus crassostreae]OAB72085.1 RNA methyltransferase [Paenibacillus crassostreae]